MTFFSVAHTPTTRRKSDIVSHFSLAMIIISVEQITTTTHAHERKKQTKNLVCKYSTSYYKEQRWHYAPESSIHFTNQLTDGNPEFIQS